MVGNTKPPARNEILWSRPGFLARRLHQINVAIFLAEFEHWKITPNQWGVMTVVASTPGLSHTEIAVQCGIDRVNVRDIVIRLEDKGIIKQKRNAKDRRQSSAFITEYGKTLLRELEPTVRRAHDILLSPLPPRDREIFLVLLRRLVDKNNELSRAPLPLNPPSSLERKPGKAMRYGARKGAAMALR